MLLLDVITETPLDEPLRLFGIKVYNDDIYELLARLALTMLVTYTIVLKIFKSTKKDSEFIFTYLIFSPLVFFICHLFASTDLSIGFAFGLFAVFSILRYRTTTMPVKEMTYMFIIIAIAVLNAISTKKVSHLELLFTNAFIMVVIYLLEKRYSKSVMHSRALILDNVELIAPGNEAALIADLQSKIGHTVIRYEIAEANYVRDTAKVLVFYKETTTNS